MKILKKYQNSHLLLSKTSQKNIIDLVFGHHYLVFSRSNGKDKCLTTNKKLVFFFKFKTKTRLRLKVLSAREYIK